MKIVETPYVCPKCKKEYKNRYMASCNSHMAKAAKDFVKSNKPITMCPACNVRLVVHTELKYFDDNGDFCAPIENITLNCPTAQMFDVSYKWLYELSAKLSALGTKDILLEGSLDIQEKSAKEKEAIKDASIQNTQNMVSSIIVKAVVGKETRTLYNITLDTVDYAKIGDKYNAFYGDYLSTKLKNDIEFFKRVLLYGNEYKIKTNYNFNIRKEILTYKY